MELQRIAIDQVNPAAYNPKKDLKPGDREYEDIKQSIQEYELVEPLVWNRRTGNLVDGHQRLKVLRELGHREVDVSVVDMDLPREKALNIALAKVKGVPDEAALDQLLAELSQEQEKLFTGYPEQELEDRLLKMQAEQAEVDYRELLGQAVERPDQAPPAERIEIILRAGPDVLTREKIKALRKQWAPLGVEITIRGADR